MISAKQFMNNVSLERIQIKNKFKSILNQAAIDSSRKGYKIFEVKYFREINEEENYNYEDNYDYLRDTEILKEIRDEIESNYDVTFLNKDESNINLNCTECTKCLCKIKWIHDSIMILEVIEPDEIEETLKEVENTDLHGSECIPNECKCNNLENID